MDKKPWERQLFENTNLRSGDSFLNSTGLVHSCGLPPISVKQQDSVGGMWQVPVPMSRFKCFELRGF